MADATKFVRMVENVKRLREEKRGEEIKNKRLREKIKGLEKIIKALTL